MLFFELILAYPKLIIISWRA